MRKRIAGNNENTLIGEKQAKISDYFARKVVDKIRKEQPEEAKNADSN